MFASYSTFYAWNGYNIGYLISHENILYTSLDILLKLFCVLWCRSDECDVRIQLPEVANEHCKLVLTEKGQVCGSIY